jgi:cytochrome c553
MNCRRGGRLRHFGARLLTLVIVVANASAHAQSPEKLKSVMADSAARPTAIEAGRKASFFCANCHGADGNSKLPEVPNLAGQNPVYLLNQVNKFYTGERKDQWMEPAIKLLSESERLNIVAYYATMRVTPAGLAVADQSGRQIYQRVCARCHGDQALGGERYPRLAGQQNTYLVKALTNYRNRAGSRMEPEMLAMTAALKDTDIKAIADYLSALR